MSSASPFPLDPHATFQTLFNTSANTKPCSLPIENPTKSFWTHPGLTRDYPVDVENDPEGSKAANPLSHEGCEGSLTNDADLVIIGSGITGVSVAFELSRKVREDEAFRIDGRKFKVVIVEARDFCSGATARNGGHLTATYSKNYSHYASLYNAEETKRCFMIEQHTVSALLSIIGRNGWEQYIDLVDGGHNELLFSKKHEETARRDSEASLKAGTRKEEDVQWFDREEVKRKYGTSFVMWRSPGHNLWPLKLVTKLFEVARDGERITEADIRNTTAQTSNENPGYISGLKDIFTRFSLSGTSQPSQLPLVANTTPNSNSKERKAGFEDSDPYELILHTHTPAHSVIPCQTHTSTPSSPKRKWTVQTSRGDIHTDRVVYATNGYTSHLIPHLAGLEGIVPIRGQVLGIRAKIGYTDEGWEPKDGVPGLSRSGWSGNQGYEYWFPRPHPPPVRQEKLKDEASQSSETLRKPLVILGGGREALSAFGINETDDSVLDPAVSEGLRHFLGTTFPGQFLIGDEVITERDCVEVEWSGIMGFTKSGDPLVGRVKDPAGAAIPGQYLSAGYTGHGMPRAYGCAEALTSLVWNDIISLDKPWTPPEWIPRHYLTESF